MRRRLMGCAAPLAMLLLGCVPARANYSYFYSDSFNSINGNWTQHGSPSGGSGLTSSSAASLIYNQGVPSPANNYEVMMTLGLTASGGTYLSYLRASSDAFLSQSGAATGTFFAVEVGGVTVSGGSCSMTVTVVQSVAGSVSSLGASSLGCTTTTVIRSVLQANGVLTVYVNGINYFQVSSGAIGSGQPGVGVIGTPAGNSLQSVGLGQLDTVAPSPVSTQTIGVSAFPNRVDLQWQGANEVAGGTGVYCYLVYRGTSSSNQVWLDGDLPTTFSDFNVSQLTLYYYTIVAIDFHGNQSSTTITVQTPQYQVDPRRVGTRPTGTYWGSGGEQIDVASGNLNYTVPLIKAQGRGGWTVPFNLTYNSQNWRQDSGGVWNLGRDVGYGYGWKLLAGSLTPYYYGWFNLDHYVFTDASGAEYVLRQSSGNVWSGADSAYVWFDANAGKLYFRDGSFWTMGCTSAGVEQDSGTMYPTAMEDSNGNQITVSYGAGVQAVGGNSSGRISVITDIKSGQNNGGALNQYSFNYSGTQLAGITNTAGTAENYTFGISGWTLTAPFGSGFGSLGVTVLGSVTQTGTGLVTAFQYDLAGEMTQVLTPYKGVMQWVYNPWSFPAGGSQVRQQMEVTNRYTQAVQNVSAVYGYSVLHEASTTTATHQWTIWRDGTAGVDKAWWFQADGSVRSELPLWFEHRPGGSAGVTHVDYGWTADAAGNLYVGSTQETRDTGLGSSVTRRTAQTLDGYGNVTGVQQWGWGSAGSGSPGALARTYANTYLHNAPTIGPNYVSRYILNRLVTSTVTDAAGKTATLASNTYDGAGLTDIASNVSGLAAPLHDTAYDTNFHLRGLLTGSVVPGATSNMAYDTGGNVLTATRNGVTTTAVTGAGTNYSAPSQITTNSLTTQLGYNNAILPNWEQGPNSDTVSITYDSNMRPASTKGAYGAVAYFYYLDAQRQKVTLTNGHGTRTTFDGFGRTVMVETGTGVASNGVVQSFSPVSVVETQYAACGCNPLGKVSKTSLPHAPGVGASAVVWTVYTYDGLGRTVGTATMDGNRTYSRTTYAYSGNLATVTDAAGHAKTFTMDALGNLAQVQEADPNLGTVYTYYSYDVLNHLTQVSMPRGGTTQTRTFSYTDGGGNVGPFLLSATNPENGTVSYTYSGNRLATKTDAKGQQFVYSYDGYGRVTQVSGAAQTSYYYDYNPVDAGFSQSALGRLTGVTYGGGSPVTAPAAFSDWYSYSQAGQVTAKRLKVVQQYRQGSVVTPLTVNLDASFSYNDEGKPVTLGFPNSGPVQTYSYDSMGRPSGLTQSDTGTLVSGVNYGVANEMLSMSYLGYAETRSYNALFQVTQIKTGLSNAVNYVYPTDGTNAGRACMAVDTVSGEQVVYQYDSLNRLARATAYAGTGATVCGGASGTVNWDQSYSFDGFGNLTGKSGVGPSLSVVVDPTTNRLQYNGYDANGNMTWTNNAPVNGTLYMGWDSMNRMAYTSDPTNGTSYYGYDAGNRKVWKWNGVADGNGNAGSYSVWFYGVDGRVMGSYGVTLSSGSGGAYLSVTGSGTQYFAGRLLAPLDRLGLARQSGPGAGLSFYPFGEDKVGNAGGDGYKFATYTREGATGLDYAVNRWYSSGLGRFMGVDAGSGGSLDNPQSLNLFGYVLGDPINHLDPFGLCDVFIGGITQSGNEEEANWAQAVGAISAFPYAGGTKLSGTLSVVVQGASIPNGATAVALNAIALAAQGSGKIDIIAFSGGAQAFSTAYKLLTPAVQDRIASITYLAPGAVSNFAVGRPGTDARVFTDSSDTINQFLQLLGGSPNDPQFHNVGINTSPCSHNLSCIIERYSQNFVRGNDSPCDVGAGSIFGPPVRYVPLYVPFPFGGFGSYVLFPVQAVPSVTSKITFEP